ncbi:hypothetical protein [Streptomyces sp. 2A115]|uniref:hypothetical protein n=1 Tax=Streptomyces sp. 2A115 TaxID=3457439 RepID=UPI003FD59905
MRGRRELHNEYCEYAVVTAPDSQGRLRPKRVQITPGLPEYHLTLATHAPVRLREIITGILGNEPRWEELYGPGATDPEQLTPAQRRVRFARPLTGHGGDRELAAAVPAAPVGSLNSAQALFMAHPINGLDDLIFIVLFGARPSARRSTTGRLEPRGPGTDLPPGRAGGAGLPARGPGRRAGRSGRGVPGAQRLTASLGTGRRHRTPTTRPSSASPRPRRPPFLTAPGTSVSHGSWRLP